MGCTESINKTSIPERINKITNLNFEHINKTSNNNAGFSQKKDFIDNNGTFHRLRIRPPTLDIGKTEVIGGRIQPVILTAKSARQQNFQEKE